MVVVDVGNRFLWNNGGGQIIPNGKDMATVTICATKLEKKALKLLALGMDMAVPDLFQMCL